MKNRNTTPYIVISILAVILVGGFIFLRLYSPKYSWYENLNSKNDQPYGLSILYNLVKDSYTKDQFNEIKSEEFNLYFKENPNSNYIFIGSNYYIDSTNVKNLIHHISKGNKAFIASTNGLETFINLWLNNTDDELVDYIETDTITSKLLLNTSKADSTFTFYFQYLKETSDYLWPYFTYEFFNSSTNYKPKIISTIEEGKPNFVSMNIGKGTLYLHSTPIFFSNYHMLNYQTYVYFKSIWNEIRSEEIIWDSFSSTVYNKSSFSHLKESPLRFILKHKSLRWAWYTLLVAIILFIAIQSKRKQSVIPLIKRKKNNTLEYAKAIGALYFEGKNHGVIADEMVNQLHSFIKARYNIKIGKDKDAIISRLSILSGIKEKKLSELFRLEIKLKYDENADSEQLYKLYNSVDYFYNNCN